MIHLYNRLLTLQFILQEREGVIQALKEENERLLAKVRCFEDPENQFYNPDSSENK